MNSAKRKLSRTGHMDVDTLGPLLTLDVMPADTQDRAQVMQLTAPGQDVTGASVELAVGHQGAPGAQRAAEAVAPSIQVELIMQSA